MSVKAAVRPVGRGIERASFVTLPADAESGVQCPHCHKKVAEQLRGTLVMVCPRCKERLVITR